MGCVSHALQIFVCSWKSGIYTYRASMPNSVQHLCWPALESERPSSDLLQENLELYPRVWIIQAVLSRARAGMSEQSARRYLKFQSPKPNLSHVFIHWIIWDPWLSWFCFLRPLNNGISESGGSPAWAGRGFSWASPTSSTGEFNPFPSKDGALVSAAFVSFGCWLQMASCAPVLYLQEALHALRFLKWHQRPLLKKLNDFLHIRNVATKITHGYFRFFS